MLEAYRIHTQMLKTFIWGSDSGAIVTTRERPNGIKYTTAGRVDRGSPCEPRTQEDAHVRDRTN